MKRSAVLAIAFLCCLALISTCIPHAQIIHENPDTLTPVSPLNANQQLSQSVVDMFEQMDSLMTALNSSDTNASRESRSFRDTTARVMRLLEY